MNYTKSIIGGTPCSQIFMEYFFRHSPVWNIPLSLRDQDSSA
nr:MAG TPA: hypothetical protein [Caudoviricetes sp.]